MEISPEKQNIDKVFSGTRYYIDFYQRQYKWNDVPVKRLLEDVFYKFKEQYQKHKDSDIKLEQLITKYNWYYLNTYITNISDGKTYVVDGQQRLTTLTLILIKLKHLAKKHESKLGNWISTKIVGLNGYDEEFWMNHEAHIQTLQELFDGKSIDEIKTDTGITALNMVKNYKLISKYLDDELKNKHLFETFTFYFLHRLVLINLDVAQTDVSMVFEVINDRGVKLKPYEILKGKLLGQVPKEELENLKLNDLWEKQVELINSYREDEIDTFFVYYLKSKFANTRGEAQKFDKDYHRVMFEDDVNNKLKLEHNSKQVKKFLKDDFVYYTKLYSKIWNFSKNYNKEQTYLYFNEITDMNTRFLLVLSSCAINDPEENEKLKLISYHLDRLFCLLQLQRSWNSNEFATNIHFIASEIREKPVNEIEEIFNKYLLQMLSNARGVEANTFLSYSFFKDTGIELEKRFKRYFFARIELFLAENTNMQMKHGFYDLVQNTGWKNGFHIEHILAHNDENLALFQGDNELFERERNRLGGLLLLKGSDNQSSGNETYAQKLKSYANSLYWNETLRDDSYKSKKDFEKMIQRFSLPFRAMNSFGHAELEERHKLLFDIVKIIWDTK